MTLSNLELIILDKLVFYGEYRMKKLDIIKIISNKIDINIDINYEGEELYIEYLKSLSKNK